jgi:hypothetical protein
VIFCSCLEYVKLTVILTRLGKYYCGGENSWSVSTDDLAEDDYDMEDSMSGLATSA